MDEITKVYDGNVQMIDSSIVRVHQHAAGAKRGGDRCMGRSRGGLTTKIHVLADRLAGRSLGAHPWTNARWPGGGRIAGGTFRGRRRARRQSLRCRCDPRAAEAQGAAPNIPARSTRKTRFCFSRRLYKARNRIERLFNKLKQFRRVATRYEKLAATFIAMIKLACVRLWLRGYESTT